MFPAWLSDSSKNSEKSIRPRLFDADLLLLLDWVVNCKSWGWPTRMRVCRLPAYQKLFRTLNHDSTPWNLGSMNSFHYWKQLTPIAILFGHYPCNDIEACTSYWWKAEHEEITLVCQKHQNDLFPFASLIFWTRALELRTSVISTHHIWNCLDCRKVWHASPMQTHTYNQLTVN